MATYKRIDSSAKGFFEWNVLQYCYFFLLIIVTTSSTAHTEIQSSFTDRTTPLVFSSTGPTQIITDTQPTTKAALLSQTSPTIYPPNQTFRTAQLSGIMPSSQVNPPLSTRIVIHTSSVVQNSRPPPLIQSKQDSSVMILEHARSTSATQNNQSQSTVQSNETQPTKELYHTQSTGQGTQTSSSTSTSLNQSSQQYQDMAQSTQSVPIIQYTSKQQHQAMTKSIGIHSIGILSTIQNTQLPSTVTVQTNQSQLPAHHIEAPLTTMQLSLLQSTIETRPDSPTPHSNQYPLTTHISHLRRTIQDSRLLPETGNIHPSSTIQREQHFSMIQSSDVSSTNESIQLTEQNVQTLSKIPSDHLPSSSQTSQLNSTQNEGVTSTTQGDQTLSPSQSDQLLSIKQSDQVLLTTQIDQTLLTLRSDHVLSSTQGEQALPTTQTDQEHSKVHNTQIFPTGPNDQSISTFEIDQQLSTPQSNQTSSMMGNLSQSNSLSSLFEIESAVEFISIGIYPSSQFDQQSFQSLTTPELNPSVATPHISTAMITQNVSSINPIGSSSLYPSPSYAQVELLSTQLAPLSFSDGLKDTSNDFEIYSRTGSPLATTHDSQLLSSTENTMSEIESAVDFTFFSIQTYSSFYQQSLHPLSTPELDLPDTNPYSSYDLSVENGQYDSSASVLETSNEILPLPSTESDADFFSNTPDYSLQESIHTVSNVAALAYSTLSFSSSMVTALSTETELVPDHSYETFRFFDTKSVANLLPGPSDYAILESTQIVSDVFSMDSASKSFYPNIVTLLQTETELLPDYSNKTYVSVDSILITESSTMSLTSIYIEPTSTQISDIPTTPVASSFYVENKSVSSVNETSSQGGPYNSSATFDTSFSITLVASDTMSLSTILPPTLSSQQNISSLAPSFDPPYTEIGSETPKSTAFTQSGTSIHHSSISYNQTTTTVPDPTPINNTNTTVTFDLKGKCAIAKLNKRDVQTLHQIISQISNKTNIFQEFPLLNFQPCKPVNFTVQIPANIQNKTVYNGDNLVNLTIIQNGERRIIIINIHKIDSDKGGLTSIIDSAVIYLASCICGLLLVLFSAFILRQTLCKNGISRWKRTLTSCRDMRKESLALGIIPRSGSLYSEMKDHGSVASHISPTFIYSTIENESEPTTSFMNKSDLRRSSGRLGKYRRSVTKKSKSGHMSNHSFDQNQKLPRNGTLQGNSPYGLVVGLMGVRAAKEDDVYAVPKKLHKKRKVYGLAVRPTASIPKASAGNIPKSTVNTAETASEFNNKPTLPHRPLRYHKRYLKHGEVSYSREDLVPRKQKSQLEDEKFKVESGIDNPVFDDYDSDKSTHI